MMVVSRRARVRAEGDRESGVRLVAAAAAETSTTYDDLRAVARACHAAAVGLDVCARRAQTDGVAERARELARDARAAADYAGALVPGGVRGPSTSERLRWEWLASTAVTIDGRPERRVACEAMVHLESAAEAAERLRDEEADASAVFGRVAAVTAAARALVAAS